MCLRSFVILNFIVPRYHIDEATKEFFYFSKIFVAAEIIVLSYYVVLVINFVFENVLRFYENFQTDNGCISEKKTRRQELENTSRNCFDRWEQTMF